MSVTAGSISMDVVNNNCINSVSLGFFMFLIFNHPLQ